MPVVPVVVVLALNMLASVIIFVVLVPTALPILPLLLINVKVVAKISGLDELTSFTILPVPLALKLTLVASAPLAPLITLAKVILPLAVVVKSAEAVVMAEFTAILDPAVKLVDVVAVIAELTFKLDKDVKLASVAVKAPFTFKLAADPDSVKLKLLPVEAFKLTAVALLSLI